MRHADSHLSDEQILRAIDGEVSSGEELRVREHLHVCWKCRVREQELAQAIALFVEVGQRDVDLPPIAGPRAMLKARLAEMPETQSRLGSRLGLAAVAVAFCVFALGLIVGRSGSFRNAPQPRAVIVSTPNAKLTPGAALLVNRYIVCSLENTNNKAVPVALRRKVFEEYGIPGDEPRAYEVDYLVTPALGGADDIRNLWPHSRSATVWNAEVKDALEDRLRAMVCDGTVDLSQAQREIAEDWIAAYRKYFHTERPLVGTGK
jgi:hypothetical protein